jgi:hypothetical protein
MTSLVIIVTGCSNISGRLKVELTRNDDAERVTRIELAWPAWKAGALPLSYTRIP